ncbi:MAG: D-2-hydroxyacid dehydrogenase family protein [Pseudomonadota bacterium]
MPLQIAIIDDYQRIAASCAQWSRLPARTQLRTFEHAFMEEDEAAAALAPFDVIVAMRERTAFPDTLLARLPKLSLLVATGGRNGAIDRDACLRRGIIATGTRSDSSGLSGTAEMTWALILAVVKRLPQESAALRAGRWQTGVTDVVDGKTLGIAGLGRIGERVARAGHAFGMRVIAWSPNLTAERAAAAGTELVTKQALFERADVVSLHLALGRDTRAVVAREELFAMKRSAVLVNTARAGLLAPGALVEALENAWIAGAGLDVYDTEPLPLDDPLRSFGNLVLTPHLGYVTRDNYRAFYSDALEKILAWVAGLPPDGAGG